jgi:hypothetical protein
MRNENKCEICLIESQPVPPVITPELKLVYPRAAKLMHPDRATTDLERLHRNVLMAQVNHIGRRSLSRRRSGVSLAFVRTH